MQLKQRAFSSGRRAQNESSQWNLINIHVRHCDLTAWILKNIAYQCDCAIIQQCAVVWKCGKSGSVVSMGSVEVW